MITREPIGITCVFKNTDKRLTEKTDVICSYADRNGAIRHKTVSVTLAEKLVIESIAMRLFLDHKRVVQKLPEGEDGKVALMGVVGIDYLED